MSRRRSKAKFFTDGVLIVNKPKGLTSHDVVARLRYKFKPTKVGHTGTLDPFATGILVLAFNRATRLVDLLGKGTKTYKATCDLGTATDTGDHTGEVVESCDVSDITFDRVQELLLDMVGTKMQAPPAYSAAKYNGKPLYSYARQGIKIEKPSKEIIIKSAKALEVTQGKVGFEITCSRGTYIRPLGEELAKGLGTCGHLSSLERTFSDPFTLDEAIEFDEALALTPLELENRLVGLSFALKRCGLAKVSLNDDHSWELRQGRILSRDLLLANSQENAPIQGEPFRVLDPQGDLVAVLRWLDPRDAGPGREYEAIRVFPKDPNQGSVGQNEVPLLKAE